MATVATQELESQLAVIDGEIAALKKERLELRKQLNTALAVENMAAQVGPENVGLLKRFADGETLTREEMTKLILRKNSGGRRLEVQPLESKAGAADVKGE